MQRLLKPNPMKGLFSVGWALAHPCELWQQRRLPPIPLFGGQVPTLHVKCKDMFGFGIKFVSRFANQSLGSFR
jgi:hypothetical protein